MITPSLQKNDTRANWLIITFSIIVSGLVAFLGNFHFQFNLSFNPHIFAKINAVINSIVTVLLILALVFVKQKKFEAHRNTMYAAMALSIVFLASYVTHHLLAGDTHFGGVGTIRYVYFIMLITHILIVVIILPFILYTAYRGMIGEYSRHKKLAKYTWPLWLYVSATGPVIYLMISPYYN